MIKLNTFQSLRLSGVHRRKSRSHTKTDYPCLDLCTCEASAFPLSVSISSFHKEHKKNPLSVQSSLNIQQPLWTGNASSLWRVMLSTAVKSLSLCVFLSRAHTLVVVYLCQVKQYPCLPMSWMLALMCSSYCGHCASSTLPWPIRRKRGLPAGSCSGGPWPERPLPL